MATVLIVDDEPNIRRMVGALLTAEGHQVIDAGSGADGVARADEEDPDVVLLDLMMPGSLDGMATLQHLKETHVDLPVIMMSGRAGLSDAVTATKLGAINFLEKPLSPEGVLFAIGAALELRQSRRVARELRQELGLAGDMVGDSPEMKQIAELIDRVAASDSRILITGESGTGKELVASAIHDASTRRDKPFVRVNCAAIPRDLVESEMFGHEKGAFTGATQTRIGRFELANTGTLFLDEIGDLSADAQAKLLRAIEAKEIQRVGGNHSVKIDVRIVAATNHDLARAVQEGKFREDLFFRLNVIPLALPPLRERAGDVPLLVRHFSLLHFKRTGQLPPAWTNDAMDAMEKYSWPGNVRELANIVERLSIMQPGAEVTGARVREVLRPVATPDRVVESVVPQPVDTSLSDVLDDYERRLINDAIDASKGNIAEAARRLKTDRPNLYRRMKRLGIGLLAVAALLVAPRNAAAQADSVRKDTTFDIRSILGEHEDRGGLTLTSGKAYNRVEGLPIMIGPSFRGFAKGAALKLSVLGIIRTAHSAHWDSENIGHRVTAEARFGGHLGYSVGATSFDVVTPIERWQMPEPDAGLSAILFKRDYLDYYGRHGGRLFASAFAGDAATIDVEYGHERWSSRKERDVTSLFRGARDWRIDPLTDDGVMHVFETHLLLDSRNAVLNPWAGWFLDGRYEYGAGKIFRRDVFAVLRPVGYDGDRVDYGRAFFDIRKYNRISPITQLNARLVVGGWLHGDRLPLERRVSVGGPGTIPGFDFRRVEIGPDVGQCADVIELPGRPAQCDRVILAQVEYRNELHSDLIDVFNRNGLRLRGYEFNVRPSIVAFADAGRGWIVGPRNGDLTYPSGSIPLEKYRTDVGLGLDLGVAGFYVAKAVSTPKEPANFFVRIHNRF